MQTGFVRDSVFALLLTSALAGSVGAATAQESFVPATPEPGTEVPVASVKFGMRPYADNTIYVIAMKKGWFEDAGIRVEPQPYGLQVTEQTVTASLLNGQLDISTATCPLMLPTYKSTDSIKCIAFTDDFVASSILANPKLGLKTFQDYIDEGMNFADALHAALAPLAGKELVTTPQLSQHVFQEGVSKLADVNWSLATMEDSRQLVLASQGRFDFVSPGGAPTVYTLVKPGWTRLVDMRGLLKYGPGGMNSPLTELADIPGIAGNTEFVSKNPNTVLRFLSVVWRTLDAVTDDPSLHELQAPYMNGRAGTNLTGSEVAETIRILDPLTMFEDNDKYYLKEDSPTFYKNVYSSLIKNYEKNGILPQGAVTPEKFVWGDQIWRTMVDYRDRTQKIFETADPAKMSEEQKDLLERSKQYFEWYNYLDAYRLANAAIAN